MKQQLVFYRTLSNISSEFENRISRTVFPTTSAGAVFNIISKWERGEFSTLFMPRSLVAGWRTKLTADQVDVHFVGPRWSPEEMAQGRARLSSNIKPVPDKLGSVDAVNLAEIESMLNARKANAKSVTDEIGNCSRRLATLTDALNRTTESIKKLEVEATKLRGTPDIKPALWAGGSMSEAMKRRALGVIDTSNSLAPKDPYNPFFRDHGKLHMKFDSIRVRNGHNGGEVQYLYRNRVVYTQYAGEQFTGDSVITILGMTGVQEVTVI